MTSFLVSLFAATPTVARAQATAPAPSYVILLNVAPDPALDAPHLRASIGAELRAEVVEPGDPRAKEATGTIRISIDRSRRALVVAYSGQAEPIERTIDLPADAAAIENEAVLLAGNLARDEAGELAASLRKPKHPPGHAPLSAEDIEANRDLDKLGAIVADGQKESSVRWAITWPLLGVGTALATVSAVLPKSVGSTAPSVAEAGGTAFMIGGLIVLPGSFDRLAADYDSRASSWPRETRDALEGEWLDAAKTERRWHRAIGLPVAVAGGVCSAVGAGFAVYVAGHPGSDLASSFPLASDVGATVACAEALSGGVYMATRPGLIEGKLREYERATGRIAHLPKTEGEVSWQPTFIPATGGGMLGIGGTF